MRQKQKGFTLLEVLVAMVVLSVGLLGLAGLMGASMRNNQSSSQRTQAAWLAYDVIDRMRGNRTAAIAAANNYNTTIGGTACAFIGLACIDLTDWKATLAYALPAGDGAVAVIPATGAVKVTIQWNDSRGTGGNSAQNITVDTQL